MNLLPSSVDVVNNEISTTGLTAFSTFGVVNQSTFAQPVSIPGKGNSTLECALEFLLANPDGANVLDGAGNPSAKQTCQDGDTNCDFDDVVGQCTFHAAVCLNTVDDRFPACHVDQVNILDVKNPSAKQATKTAADLANRDALTGVTEVALALPDGRDDDCAPVTIVVPMKQSGATFRSTKYKVKLKATFLQTLPSKPTKKKTDTDKLQLTCNPA